MTAEPNLQLQMKAEEQVLLVPEVWLRSAEVSISKAKPTMEERDRLNAEFGRQGFTLWKCGGCGAIAQPRDRSRTTLEGLPCPRCLGSTWNRAEYELCHWCPRYIAVDEMTKHLEHKHGEEWRKQRDLIEEEERKMAEFRKEHIGQTISVYNREDGWPIGLICGLLLAYILSTQGVSGPTCLAVGFVAGLLSGLLYPIISAKKRKIE